MEFEQIIKRIDWLEKERQKDRETIASLKEQIASMETSVNAESKQLKTLSKQVTEISSTTSRINQFEEMFTKQRADLKKAIDENEKRSQRREAEAAKIYHSEIEQVAKEIAEHKKTTASAVETKKKFKEHTD